MGPRKPAAWLGVALAAAIIVAGCGGSSSSKASTTNSSAAPPPASTSSSTPTVSVTVTSPTATTTTTASGKFDSCSVVTQAEAASAIGATVSSGVLGHATVEGGLACVFYGSSSPSPHNPNVAQPDSVRVVVVKGPHAAAWYKDYKSKVSFQPVSGFGDQAYYDGYASLSVLKGDSYLRIAVAPLGAPPSLADEKKLATAILPKL